jgi:hypothetical protein
MGLAWVESMPRNNRPGKAVGHRRIQAELMSPAVVRFTLRNNSVTQIQNASDALQPPTNPPARNVALLARTSASSGDANSLQPPDNLRSIRARR